MHQRWFRFASRSFQNFDISATVLIFTAFFLRGAFCLVISLANVDAEAGIEPDVEPCPASIAA